MRVQIVSDVRLFRFGIALSLQRAARIEVVGTVESGHGLYDALRDVPTDVVLLDMAMPGSLDVVHAVLASLPGTRLVGFALSDAGSDIVACAEAGVVSYVLRDGSVDDLVAAIDGAMRDELRCSPRVAAQIVRRLATLSASLDDRPRGVPLTRREAEIVALIDQGLSNKEIARRLCIGTATVKNHVHNLLEKLRVHRRGEAAAALRVAAVPARRRYVSPPPGASARI